MNDAVWRAGRNNDFILMDLISFSCLREYAVKERADLSARFDAVGYASATSDQKLKVH